MAKLHIHKRSGIAGQVRYAIARKDEHGIHNAVFVGTVYGTPGPVVMIMMDGVQVHVTDPSRFGPSFDEEWIRNFYA